MTMKTSLYSKANVKNKLTDKQRIFVAEYLIDRNATQAAIRAGFSENGARQAGSRLLSNVNVRSLIDQKIERQIKRAELTADKVNEVLAGMIMTDACDLYEEGPDGTMIPKSADELTSRQRASIQEITLMAGADGSGYQRIKQYDRLRAIDIYYKRTGIYSDSGTTNNIAKMHVNILELNAAKRRAGLPEIEE